MRRLAGVVAAALLYTVGVLVRVVPLGPLMTARVTPSLASLPVLMVTWGPLTSRTTPPWR